MARTRARYAQRTERQRLHDAHQKRMARGACPAAGEYGSLSVINSAAQRLKNKVLLIEPSLLHSDWKTGSVDTAFTCSSVPATLYYLLTFFILLVRFVDAETRRASQQHQANVNAAAEAAALRAMHEESARQAGEPKGGRAA